MQSYGRRDERAFTLLELLVAMSLMSVIAASLYASLSIGFKARDSSENVVAVSRTTQIAIELMEQEIVAALPPKGILAGQFEGVDETDDAGFNADTLLLYSASHEPGDEEVACDIRKIEISLVRPDDSEDRVLVRSITTNLLSPKALEPEEEILCSGVRSLDLKYFDGYDWLDGWNSIDHQDSLPIAVEISLGIENMNDDEEEKGEGYLLTHAFILPCR